MKRIAAAMALLLVMGSAGNAAAATLKSIDQDGLNLRSGPGTTYGVVGSLPAGQSAKVLEQKENWFKVRTAAGVEAWVAGWVSRINYEDEQAYALVDTDALNFRKEPSTTGAVLAVLKTGERVRLLEIAGDWWRVRRESGAEGYVNGMFMKLTTALATTPQQPVTPPATPPVTQPQQPPAKPPEPETPAPQAPAWAVPSLPLLPPPPAGRPAGPKEVLATAAATVYTGRNASAFDPVDKVKAGESLKYLDAAEGWVKVQTPRGLRGWIPGQNVTITEGKLTYALKEGAWSFGYSAVAPAPAPAPAATPAPAPAPAPSSTRYVERRIVKEEKGYDLRQEPNDLARVITRLPKGEILELRGLSMPWIQVATLSGQLGWVHVSATDLYTGPVPTPAAPTTPTTPTTPAVPANPATPSLKAALTILSPGVFQLEVTSTAKPLGEPKAEGSTLVIPVALGESATSALPLGTGGAKELLLTPAGVTLAMEALPGWQVTQKSPSRMVVVLRSTVTAVSAQVAADRTIYKFGVAGTMLPRTKAAGNDTLVDFPGATSAVTGALPPGLKLQTTATGVQAAVTSRRPYSLKRVDGGFELHLYQSGLAGKTIVLDPGHGGPDSGAVNKTIGLRESDANLGIALRLRALLAAKGANVLMTRITDTRPAPAAVLAQGPQDDLLHVDLGYRSRMANEMKADAFLSIHNNCCSGSGTETYYTSGILNGDRSASLARLVQQELPAGLGQTNRGAKDDLMYVTRTADVPSVLVEVAFVSHAVEGPLLKKSAYQDQVAALLVKSLERFFAERTD
ncbi:MAG TPA: SH3 domain-containing protein [Symbiobacteriaceae bacterium]|nr:SH3 domain-containing protein [Symbiobacteriaceae bacterium]